MLKNYATTLTLLILLCLVNLTHAQYTDESADYESSRLWIGGGGFWTGMVFHPDISGLSYVRSDVCMPYRLDPGEDVWDYTGDYFDPGSYNPMGGCEGIAVGSDPDVVYGLFGAYLSFGDAGLYKSSDRGESWTQVLQVYVDGNDDGSLQKKRGEPMAVDPNNDNVIYVGTQKDGLYRSLTGGDAGTWTQVASIPVLSDVGTKTVAIDPASTVNGRSSVVYASVEGTGVYQSTDGGDSFSLMSGSPLSPTSMTVDASGTLYVSATDGVWKYAGSTWSDITPSDQVGNRFIRMDVNALNNSQLLAIMTNGRLYRSQDAGASWDYVSRDEGTMDDATPGFDFFRDPASSPDFIRFDPHTGDAYMGDAYAIWKCTDPYAADTKWVIEYKGLNNTITIDMAAPPKGESNGIFYSASPDAEGFRFDGVDQTWHTKFSRLGPNAPGIDFCEENPDVLYYTKQKKWSPTYQAWVFRNDDGMTNTTSNNFVPDNKYYKTYPHDTQYNAGYGSQGSPAQYNCGGAKIAVSATDPMNAVYFSGGFAEETFYTKDGGDSWILTVGLPYDDFVRRDCGNGSCSEYDFNMPLAADMIDGDIFYAYYDREGEFFVSHDGGANWTKSENEGLPSFSGKTQEDPFRLETAPYIAGEVWIAISGQGVYASSDTGKTFTKNPFFTNAYQLAFGRSKPGTSVPSVYVFGTNGSQWGIYRSDDLGANWSLVSPPSKPGANVRAMAGDRQVYGRVYTAHGSTGVRYSQLSNPLGPDTAPLAATDFSGVSFFSDRVSLSWTDNSTNENKFRIYRKSGAGSFERVGLTGFNVTSYVDKRLTPSTTYEYVVVALNEDAGTSSDTISVTTTSDANNPTVNLQATDTEASEITLDSGAYAIYLSNPVAVDLTIQLSMEGVANNSSDYSTISNTIIVPAGDTVVYVTLNPSADSNPAEGTEAAVARLTEGNGYFVGAFDQDTVNITDDPSAGVPSNVSGTGKSPTWLQVTWNDNSSGEGGFEILRSVTSGGPYDLVGSVSSNIEKFDDTNVDPATTYYYVVRATTSNGVSNNSTEGSGASLAAVSYAQDFVWDRSMDWDGNTTVAGDTDSLGSLTWSYLYNPVDSDGGKNDNNPWWEQSLEDMAYWDSNGYWEDKDGNNPKISSSELNERRDNVSDVYLGIPVVRWTNPVDKSIWVKIAGQLITEISGNSNFDRVADVVIVLKDNAGNYTKIFEERHYGQSGDSFIDDVNIEKVLKSGEQLYISIHQPFDGKYNFQASLKDNLEIKYLVDEGGTLPTPGVVSSLSASTVDFETVNLSWTDVSDEVGYRIERKADGGNYKVVTTVNKGVTTFTDKELKPSTTYTYRVVAYTIGSEAAASPESSAATEPGRLLDNGDGANNGVDINGGWSFSSFDGNGEFYGENFINDGNDNKGGDYVRFTPDLPVTGNYLVEARWVAASYYDDNVPLEVHHAAGVDTFLINQKQNAGRWMPLDTLPFNSGTGQYLDWQTYGTTQSVVVDAVRFILVEATADLNNAPVASDDSYSVNQNNTLSVNTPGVLGNDSDADSDPLTASLVSGTTNGSLTLNVDGSFTYTPNADYSGSDSFTYVANDGTDDSNTATVSITVQSSLIEAFAFGADGYTSISPNDANISYVKVIQDSSNFTYSTSQGHGYTSISSIDGTTNNREAISCDELYDQFIGVKNGGSIVFRIDVPNGDYQFVASGGDALYDNHNSTIQVRDGSAGNTVTLVDNITLNAKNYYSVTFGSKILPACSEATFVAQPTSPVLTVTNGYIEVIQSTTGNGGDLILLEIWKYTPPANEAPVASDDSYSIDQDNTLTVDVPGVLVNDTDADNDPLTVSLVSGATNGSVTLNADGSFAYTPNAGYSGSDSFAYVANDGTEDGNAATVNITVNAVLSDTTLVSDTDDDAGENDSGIIHDINGSGVQLRSGRSAASEKGMFIFRGVNVPQGATITSARVQFESRTNNTGSSALTTYLLVEDNLSPANFLNSNISSRTLVNDSVQWDIPVWTDNTKGPDQLTPDISSLVQALVNKANWVSGSSDIGVVIQGHDNKDDNWRQIKTLNGGSAPELIIEYTDNSTQRLAGSNSVRNKAPEGIGLVIYPNPAKEQIAVKGIDSGDVTVLNIHGVAVLQGKIGVERPLSIQRLNSGIYFLSITSGEHKSIHKIIVEK